MLTHQEGARAVQRRKRREAVGVRLGHQMLQEGVQVREGRVHCNLQRKNIETKGRGRRAKLTKRQSKLKSSAPEPTDHSPTTHPLPTEPNRTELTTYPP